MKPWIRTAAAAVIGASALAAGPAFAADVPAQPAASTKATSQLKIGVVNMERILRESKTAQRASDRLNEEGQRRQEEIEAMSRRFKTKLERFEKDAASMSEAASSEPCGEDHSGCFPTRALRPRALRVFLRERPHRPHEAGDR